MNCGGRYRGESPDAGITGDFWSWVKPSMPRSAMDFRIRLARQKTHSIRVEKIIRFWPPGSSRFVASFSTVSVSRFRLLWADGRFLSAYPLGNAASVSLYDIDFHSSAGVGFAWGGGLEGSCEAPPSKTMPQGSHAPSSETQRKRGERVAFSNNMSGGIARISDSHPA